MEGESRLLKLTAARELLLEEVAKLERVKLMLKQRSAHSRSTGVLMVESWILSLKNIAGRLVEIERSMERGLPALARIEACDTLELVYEALSRPRDPVYESVKTLLASIAVSLSSFCGDER